MKRGTTLIVVGVVAVGVIVVIGVVGSGRGGECRPQSEDYLGTYRQREGPGADSTVRFGESDAADGTAGAAGSPYRASGNGTWRVTDDNLVEWSLDGVNRLESGTEVRWRPTYTAAEFECDGAGRVVRISGDGVDTAPFPSRFDLVRAD